MAGVHFNQLCELRRREPRRSHDRAGQGGGGGRQAVGRGVAGEYRPAVRRRARDHRNLIGNGLLALHRNPDQWERLRADPSLIPNAVELLRYDSSVQITGRVTHAEVELGGVTIGAEQSIVALLGAANRDPAQYPDPDRLDVGRR